jgi:hypothetical protein
MGSPYGSLSSYSEGDFGLTTFRSDDDDRLGLSCTPTVLFAHDRKTTDPCTRRLAFWPKPFACVFSLSLLTTFFFGHSHMLTILSTLAFSRRHFREHTRLAVCALAFASGYIISGALQGGITTSPHPPRVLPMGRQVLSWMNQARQSSERHRVAP